MNIPSYYEFKRIIWDYYARHGRVFDWRNVDDPYKVFISEVMLQQTQTSRVAQKFPEFIARMPTFHALAAASLHDVLHAWQGLGYNRRGMYLHQAARTIVNEYQGSMPNDPDLLVKLPGIGKATAASLCAFAYNKPTIFIETNIRAVYLHCFFNGKEGVDDKELLAHIEQTVDHDNPREWYYALMDYGVMLKKTLVNPSRKSKHHTKQSKFEGSNRQIRGMILRLLLAQKTLSLEQLVAYTKKDPTRVEMIVQQMVAEKIIVFLNTSFSIADLVQQTDTELGQIEETFSIQKDHNNIA